jgi:hypothetical protein
MPKTQELKDLGSWAHNLPIILNSGRCSHYIPTGLDDEKREELEGQLNEQDKTEERFRVVADDSNVVGETPAWTSKTSGDTTTFGENCYATNVVCSNRWPGSVTVSKSGKFFTIYVGDIVKKGDNYFNPCEPPIVQSDPTE